MKSNLLIEHLSSNNLKPLTEMVLKLWPECSFEEEYQNCQRILDAHSEHVILAKSADKYIGFVQLALKIEYVEGTTTKPVLYIEGLYVEEPFRLKGVARKLIEVSKQWGIQNKCTEMASDTEIGNSGSIDFHKQIGFEEVNRIVCFKKML